VAQSKPRLDEGVGIVMMRYRENRPAVVTSLLELRALTGMTQSKLAEEMGIDQPMVSRIEKRDDPSINQLGLYVYGLGGRLSVRIELASRIFELELPDLPPPSR